MRVLIIAWEIPGFNSRQGKALSIRVGQVISGLCSLGHEMVVVHRDQVQEVTEDKVEIKKWEYQGNTIEKVAVREKSSKGSHLMTYPFFRVIMTYSDLLFLGDWSGRWAIYSFKHIKNKIHKADVIISFFTPRGPLLLGKLLGDHWNIPYFFDFQDEWDQGLRKDQRIIANMWIKRICKKTNGLVHVSPEWAMRDSNYLDKEFITLRHAVPSRQTHTPPKRDSTFRILYIGSVDRNKQDIESFFKALPMIPKGEDVIFQYAGLKTTDQFLTDQVTGIHYEYLGWQEDTDLDKYVLNASALLIFGWKSPGRMVVPSKLYYYMSFDIPILIAGKDTGSLKSLVTHWNHPNCIQEDPNQIAKVVLEGVKSDFSNYLIPSKCENVMTEYELANAYNSMIKKVVKSASVT